MPAPGVLIYSAYVDECLRLAARVAGADGLLDKNASALDLVRAIRVIHAGGRRLLEPVRPGDVRRATRQLDRQEAQILEMLLDDTPPAQAAVALSLPPASFRRRVNDILGRLCVEPPWTVADGDRADRTLGAPVVGQSPKDGARCPFRVPATRRTM